MRALSLGLTIILGSLTPLLASAREITTRDGKTYHEAQLQRVEPDGIILSYQPAGGGLGNAKLKFAILPEKLQQELGYDPQKATAFETDQIQAQQALQNKFWSEYADATNRIAIRRIEEEKQAEIEAKELAELQARKAQEEQERIAEESRIKAESDAAKQRNNPYYVPDELTGVISDWSPTHGFVPIQYQPPKDGMYRPPLTIDDLPPVPGQTAPDKQNPARTDRNGIGGKNGSTPRIVTTSKLAPVSFP